MTTLVPGTRNVRHDTHLKLKFLNGGYVNSLGAISEPVAKINAFYIQAAELIMHPRSVCSISPCLTNTQSYALIADRVKKLT